MRPVRVGRWLCALVLLAGGAAPVHAAWDNVFQVCCNSCGSSTPVLDRFRSAFYGPSSSTACCAPTTCCAPPTCCTTQYVQRCYYQPVTCYQTKTYYEPVTSYRTSYYYEPVTSYRYSCYFDPCTCSYKQVACPTTCYQLRSQTCATTSYLQRCCQVPVTSYRLSYYYEPVTTCSSPCPSPCPTPCSTQQYAAPAAAPAVGESASPMSPGVQEQRSVPSTPYQQNYPPQQPQQPYKGGEPPITPQPNGPGNTSRPTPTAAPAPPTVRLDRIVSVPAPTSGQLQGRVVTAENLPQAGVELTFVRADSQDTRQPVVADSTGNFDVKLANGGWHVYMTGRDGKPAYHSLIEVRGDDSRPVVLVSR